MYFIHKCKSDIRSYTPMFSARAASSNYELQMAYTKQMCIFLIQNNVTNTDCNIRHDKFLLYILYFYGQNWSRDRISRRRKFVSIPGRVTRFSLFQSVQTGVGPNLPPTFRQEWLDVKLTTHLQLAVEARNEWSYTSSTPYTFLCAHGQLIFYFTYLAI